MIVVDTNIVCYRWIPSPHSAAAEAALVKDPDWIAPLLWRSEFRNALAGMIRQNSITLTLAREILDKAEAHLAGREFFVSSNDVIDLAARSRCSAYDCEFVALARDQSVPLVTVDSRILHDFPKIAVALKDFVTG